MSNIKEELKNIKAFAFDVDGVLSLQTLLLHQDGEVMRSVNIKDGYALQYAVKKGYKIVIISGGDTESVRIRYQRLGINDIYLKSSNKVVDFEDYCKKNKVDPSTVLYMGDDMPDYEVMKRVGFPTCPADAADEIKALSKYISHKNGGEGCVRDVIEQVMRLHGNWMDGDAFHW